jgi:predicted ABC-type ATPase
MHETIVSKLLEGHKPVGDGRKTYTMMGGGGGAGKSSIVRSGLVELPPDHANINADDIKAALPEYKPMVKDGDTRAAHYLHEESSHLAKVAQARAFSQGINVVLDGTGNASVESVTNKIEKARVAGYRVEGEYVTCSIEEAIKRADVRAKDKNSDSYGRVVAPSVLAEAHRSVSRILPQVADKFDRLRLWDTENGTEGKPSLVMSAEGGKMTIHNDELWSKFLAKQTAPKV